MKTRIGAIALVSLVAGLGGAGSASADVPTSLAEARAQNDPAASAPVFSESADGFVYQGEPVSAETVTAKALSCLAVDKGPSRCYDDAAALQKAELPHARTSRRTRTHGPQARTAGSGTDCSIWAILFIWTGADMTGASGALQDRQRWANLGAAIDDEGSSFAMGDHSGHLAEGQGGVGNWYPGPTGICNFETNLNRNGSGWNNRISSRYRN